MKKFYLSFFLIVLAGVLFSCSTADDLEEENPPYPDITTDSEKYPAYQDAVKDICSQIESNLIHDNESLVEAAKSFSNFSGSRIVNGIQYVTFDGNWDFFVDFDGKCITREGDISTWDDSEFEDLLDQYDELLDDGSSARSSTMSDTRSLDSEQLSKATFKVLFWCPLNDKAWDWAEQKVNEFCTAISYKGEKGEKVVDCTSIRGSMTSAADLSTFNNYDVVVFLTHGSQKGQPMVPSDFKGVEKSKNVEFGYSDGTLYYALDYNFLTQYLPEMKNTVLWTMMCHSNTENSILASAALARHAGDYFGATNLITDVICLKYFRDFLLNFLLGGATSSDAFGPEQGVTYQISHKGTEIKGVFGHNTSSFKGVCHPFLSVDEPQSGCPVGFWAAPLDEMEKVVEGNGKFKAGIRLTNIDNSKTIQIPLIKENLITSTTKQYNVAESLQAVFKTDNIADGNYKYESYVTFEDGTTVYSDYSQLLTVDQTNKFTVSVKVSDASVFKVPSNNPYFEVTNVVCQEYPSLSPFWDWYSFDEFGRSHLDFHLDGLDGEFLHFDIYYKGKLKSIDLGIDVCGGILPSSVEVLSGFGNNVKVLSANETGDYTLTVPKTLIYINNAWRMDDDPALERIDLSVCSNLKEIEAFAFYRCKSLKIVNLDGCTSLTKIEWYAFRDCTSLSNCSFVGCTSLTSIEEEAFARCSSLTNIGLENLTNLQEIGPGAFFACESLKTVNLDGCTSLTKIGKGAFDTCVSLNNCSLVGCISLTSIDSDAFDYCISLTNIGLENLTNLQEIGTSAFYNTKLKSVTIPSSVKYIGGYAFEDIPKIGYVKCLPSSVPILYEDSHYYYYRLPFERDQVIYVPANAKDEYEEYWGVWEEETDADGNIIYDNEGHTKLKCINIRTF